MTGTGKTYYNSEKARDAVRKPVARATFSEIPGRCPKPKCIRVADHDGECWPKP